MKDTKYKEIFKLKEMLEEENIPHVFILDGQFEHFESYQLAYPGLNNMICSCIEGYGTYGAEKDLLEIDGLLTKEERILDTIVGNLTAIEVFNRIKEHYGNTEKKGV